MLRNIAILFGDELRVMLTSHVENVPGEHLLMEKFSIQPFCNQFQYFSVLTPDEIGKKGDQATSSESIVLPLGSATPKQMDNTDIVLQYAPLSTLKDAVAVSTDGKHCLTEIS